MTKSKALTSFYQNGNVKCCVILDENNRPISPVKQWDEKGRLVHTIDYNKCVVVFIRKRSAVEAPEDVRAQIKALEARISELESRLNIPPTQDAEKVRQDFLGFMSLIDTRSLQRVFAYFSDETIAGSILDLPAEIQTRVLSCVSRTRRREILEMMEIHKAYANKIWVETDENGQHKLGTEIGVVDYALSHKEQVLRRIAKLERMGEIVVGRAGDGEVYV